ncbi:MAG: hypothetical protein ACTSXJ_08800 [Candidatus Baldrarchaeia archaeon]
MTCIVFILISLTRQILILVFMTPLLMALPIMIEELLKRRKRLRE